ncbi:hypothetical protein D3C71_1827120 [compost metagenome]
MIVFTEILLETLAAIGDASALPMTKPATASQWAPFNMVIKVSELINAMKKRVIFTVPKENLGFLPPAIKLDKTIDPHPPPPTASIKPPNNPNREIFFTFPFGSLCFRFTLNALDRITPPRIKVYKETKGLV